MKKMKKKEENRSKSKNRKASPSPSKLVAKTERARDNWLDKSK